MRAASQPATSRARSANSEPSSGTMITLLIAIPFRARRLRGGPGADRPRLKVSAPAGVRSPGAGIGDRATSRTPRCRRSADLRVRRRMRVVRLRHGRERRVELYGDAAQATGARAAVVAGVPDEDGVPARPWLGPEVREARP